MTEQHILERHWINETKEWVDALESVLAKKVLIRAQYIFKIGLSNEAFKSWHSMPSSITTAYRITIALKNEKSHYRLSIYGGVVYVL